MNKKMKLVLLIPALWANLFDVTITTVHQPKAYWDGDLNKVNEANPIGNLFMEHHVAGLFVLSAFWIGTIILLGYYLPQRIARIFLLFCVMAHSFGASTWLAGYYGFWYVMALMVFNSILYCTVDHYANRVTATTV